MLMSLFQNANALLSQITTGINTLLLSTSPPSSSFDQPPSHTLEDLEALQGMVQRIQAVLADAERGEFHDESVKLWLRDIRCLAYDADDVLDEYNYEVLRGQVETGIQSDAASRPPLRKRKHKQQVSILTMASSSSSSSDGTTWNKLADRMRKIRVRFEEISYQREALQLTEGAVRERQNVAVRPPSSHLRDAPTIFGREEIMEEVISMLLSLPDGGEKRTLSVLPIVGMGGVGKTTLAQHVYNDRRVGDHFELRRWVCVSDDFAVESVTKRIFESLTGEACQLNEFDAIQSQLIQELEKGKRLLLVLDEVWNETRFFWDSLLKPFRSAGVEGSAVIVTTRIESIPPRMVETMRFRRLACLSDDKCRLIFQQNAFPDQDPADHEDLMQIGKKIVVKCKGLPLAAKVLGSVLFSEFDCDRWEEILQSGVWDVPDQHDEIISAQRMSYLHLPSHLKPCFLYASVFPKDYGLRKERLVQLWMAQGFLRCEGGKQMEDIGNKYFDDLMQRSLFSPFQVDTEYSVMHDTIHDLARHISQGEISSCIGKEEVDEDKFFPVGGSKVVRHLFVSHQCNENIEGMMQQYLCSDEARVIRSLLVEPSEGRGDDEEKLTLPNKMILNLESLRALELTCFGKLSELPDSMGCLRHLRHLNLRGNEDIRRLPKTIGMLYNLQYLNLNYCDGLESLPESMGRLCNLQHLSLHDCSALKSLPESIGGLCNLRYLNLHGCKRLRSLPESIGGLRNLQCLEIEDNDFSYYPRGMNRLTNLRSLVGFTVASGDIHRMDLLKDMVHLRGEFHIYGLANVVNPEVAVTANLLRNKEDIRRLCLHWGSGNGNNDDDNEKAYRVLENLQPPNGLEELEICDYNGVKFPSWMGGDHASSFPRLTHVQLRSCRRCTLLPPLGQLRSLKHLEIRDASSLERVGPEFRGVGFPALEELVFGGMSSWVTWDAPERGDFPRLRKLHVSHCPKLQSMVPLYHFPSLQDLNIQRCDSLPSIELKMPSSSSSIGPRHS